MSPQSSTVAHFTGTNTFCWQTHSDFSQAGAYPDGQSAEQSSAALHVLTAGPGFAQAQFPFTHATICPCGQLPTEQSAADAQAMVPLCWPRHLHRFSGLQNDVVASGHVTAEHSASA